MKWFNTVACLFIILAFVTVSPLLSFAQPFGMTSAPAQKEMRAETLSSANGPFVFGQISDAGKDKFMLDTATGRLWRISETGAIGIFLEPVPYRDKEGNITYVPGKPK